MRAWDWQKQADEDILELLNSSPPPICDWEKQADADIRELLGDDGSEPVAK